MSEIRVWLGDGNPPHSFNIVVPYPSGRQARTPQIPLHASMSQQPARSAPWQSWRAVVNAKIIDAAVCLFTVYSAETYSLLTQKACVKNGPYAKSPYLGCFWLPISCTKVGFTSWSRRSPHFSVTHILFLFNHYFWWLLLSDFELVAQEGFYRTILYVKFAKNWWTRSNAGIFWNTQ